MSVIYRNKRFYPDTAVPLYERNYTTITSIEVGSQKDDEITRRDAEVERLKDEARSLCIDVYNTLMSLATDKKVRENFPDAIPYLPTPQMCYLPALPIESISERLKSFSK